MFTQDDTFRNYERLMSEEEIWIDPAVCFKDVCRILGVSTRRFDRFLAGELGFTGEEILHIYRTSAYKKD